MTTGGSTSGAITTALSSDFPRNCRRASTHAHTAAGPRPSAVAPAPTSSESATGDTPPDYASPPSTSRISVSSSSRLVDFALVRMAETRASVGSYPRNFSQ